MIKRCLKILCFVVALVGMVPVVAHAEEIVVNDAKELSVLLNDTGTQSGTYRLNADITIDTNDLRTDPAKQYSFNGNLNGDGHTITVSSTNGVTGSFAPLFDTLRGSVSNLNVVFEGDVAGAPFAYDIGYQTEDDEIRLHNISVTVNGSVLYGDHDYTKYYARILNPQYSTYGNWYIHYGGQPVHLATGFAWYLWGVSVEDVIVSVTGNVGTNEKKNDDATSAGFAYFCLKGSNQNSVIYKNVTVDVKKDILAITGDGHASAYGFATGTADGSTAGFGGGSPDEVFNVHVYAQNIFAESDQGASSSMGFARFMQGYTHDCSVNVPGTIRAVNWEGDAEEYIYAYMNGSAYAYGFMLNTGGSAAEYRRSFIANSVNVGEIFAQTNATVYVGSAFASGFAHQMMNTANSVPNLSYNNNHVMVAKSITAEATAGSSVAAGFFTSSGRDYFDRPDHIFGNTVEVGGDISAKSLTKEASAAGYAYFSKTHFRNCEVYVRGNILAESPFQAISAGFVGLQYQSDSYYFIRDCSVNIAGDIKALGNGNKPTGMGAAAGLIGVMLNSDSTVSTAPVEVKDNVVSVGGTISATNENDFSGFTGLVIAYNDQVDPKKSKMVFQNNVFIGRETVIQALTDETLYTNFVGQTKGDAMEQSGNTVQFTKPDGRKYTASVKPIPDQSSPEYVLLWELTDIQEVIQQYIITAAAGEHGTITPNGTITVDEGSSQSFSIVAEAGYHIKDVVVNGQSVGAVDTYIFENIQSNGTIDASFEKDNTGGGVVDTYTLRYDTNGGAKLVSESKSAAWVKAYDELPVPIKEGAVFAGWYWDKALNKPVEDDVKINRSLVTLYAKWEKDLADPDNTGVSDWLDTVNHHAYLGGYPDNTFGGERDMTRAEVAQMFYNLLLNKNVPVTVRFDDVAEDAWYATAVNTLASLDILQGVGDNNFAPQRSITRAEFTCIAMRFAVMDAEGENVFSDVNETDWFYNDIVGSIKYGWIGGYPDGIFRPNNTITRAEVTAITNRMLGRQADQAYINHHVDELRQFIDVDQSGWAYYDIMEATNAHEYHQESGEELWSTLL